MRNVRAVGLGIAAVSGVALVVGVLGTGGSNRRPEPAAGRWATVDPEAELRRGSELRADLATAQRQLREKDTVAEALVRGELTLDEAASRFWEIHGGEIGPLVKLRLHYPNASDRELYHRNVLVFVHRAAARGVPGAAAAVPRLEAEFARKLPRMTKPIPRPPI